MKRALGTIGAVAGRTTQRFSSLMWSKLLKATTIASFGAAYVSLIGATLLLQATLATATFFAGPPPAGSKRAEP